MCQCLDFQTSNFQNCEKSVFGPRSLWGCGYSSPNGLRQILSTWHDPPSPPGTWPGFCGKSHLLTYPSPVSCRYKGAHSLSSFLESTTLSLTEVVGLFSATYLNPHRAHQKNSKLSVQAQFCTQQTLVWSWASSAMTSVTLIQSLSLALQFPRLKCGW